MAIKKSLKIGDLVKSPMFYLILFILYVTNDTFLFGTNNNILYKNIYIFSYALFGVYIFFNLLKKSYKFKKGIIYPLFLILMLTLTSLFNFDFSGGYLLHLIVYLICFYISFVIDFDSFVIYYENTLYYLTYIGIILFVGVQLFPWILQYFSVIENIAGYSKYNLWLSTFSTSDYSIIYRNSSIFREPGVYMIYLLVGLIINMFIYNKINRKHCLVFTAGLLTTFSTGGIILGTLLFFVYGVMMKSKYRILYLLFILTIIFVSLLVYSDNIYFLKIFNKLDPSSSSYGSTNSRLMSFVVPINIFLNYPIFGSGLQNFTIGFEKYSLLLSGIKISSGGMSTNFIMNKFATFGIFTGSVFVFLLYKISRKIISYKYNKRYAIIIFLLFFAAFSNEDVRFSLFFNILLFYGIKEESNKTPI